MSVIVPAYNVESYLAATVKAILRQSYLALEVVIVNDGSSDETGVIADELLELDKRVVVIHTENVGPGAARNLGLARAKGEFICFVDSDDQIPKSSIASMMRVLQESNSDFVTGAMERFDGARTWVPEWVKKTHEMDRIGIIAAEFPGIVWDVFVWKKVFRREAWDRYVGRFPEGVLYEDQEVMIKFYVKGARFDVITDTVYRWRFREDGTSITQGKRSVENLMHRLDVVRGLRPMIEASGDHGLVDAWYAKLFGDDLFWHFREVPRASDEYWDKLVAGVRELTHGLHDLALAGVEVDRRILVGLVEQGDRVAFSNALIRFQEQGSHWITALDADGAQAALVPGLEESLVGLGSRYLSVTSDVSNLRSSITRSVLSADGSVTLEGHISVKHFAPQLDRVLRARLVRVEGTEGENERAFFDLEIIRTLSPFADQQALDPFTSFEGAGFQVKLPPYLAGAMAKVDDTASARECGPDPDLVETDSARAESTCERALDTTPFPFTGEAETGESGGGVWELEVTLEEAGNVYRTQSHSVSHLSIVGWNTAAAVNQSGFRFVTARRADTLTVSVEKPAFSVVSLEMSSRSFEVCLAGPQGMESELTLVAHHGKRVLFESSLTLADTDIWKASAIIPALAQITRQNTVKYALSVLTSSGALFHVAANLDLPRQYIGGNYAVSRSNDGTLTLERYVQAATVESIDLSQDGQSLSVTGKYFFDPHQVRQRMPSMVLQGWLETIIPSKARFDEENNSFAVDFSLTKVDADFRRVFVSPGTYKLSLLLPSGHRLPSVAEATAERPLLEQLPLELCRPQTRMEIRARSASGALSIVLGLPFAPDERGPYAQRQVRTAATLLRTHRIKEGVLFESFGGRGISDSPKALDLELQKSHPDLPRYWTVRSHSVAVPSGATPLVMYSREWYEALESVRYLVNNNNFPHFFEKRPDQVHVQTWHGTPLKRIGNDAPISNFSLSYRALMKREGEQYWDFLFAQTPWAGEVLAGAFGYTGPVLDRGYPRNDALVRASSVPRRRQIREYLGLSDSQRVVLYAPTWRDNVLSASGAYSQPSYLDLAAVHKKFGRDVVVLHRGHNNTTASHRPTTGPNVIDVSLYPDVNDLYLAADLLVTDYSSTQFDFVNTNRPILYLVPDLETYRDTVRGFYFDLGAVAPGPVVSTTTEIIDALNSLDAVENEYRTAYAAFKARFAGLDDGNASARAVQEIFRS